MNKAECARDWGNRRIAHNDYELAVSSSVVPLVPTSRMMIKEAIEAISAVLNAVSGHYMESSMGFDFDEGPGTSLIFVSDDGVRARERRKAKWASGTGVPWDELPAGDR